MRQYQPSSHSHNRHSSYEWDRLQKHEKEKTLQSDIDRIRFQLRQVTNNVRILKEEVQDWEGKCRRKEEELEEIRAATEEIKLKRALKDSAGGEESAAAQEGGSTLKYSQLYTANNYKSFKGYVEQIGRVCLEDLCDHYQIRVFDYISGGYEDIKCSDPSHSRHLHVVNLERLPFKYMKHAALIQVCDACKSFVTLKEVEEKLYDCISRDKFLFSNTGKL